MTPVTFHVFYPEKPDQDAIRGGDERMSDALLLEVLGRLAHPQIWPEGHRTRLHHLLYQSRRIDIRHLSVDDSQYDALCIEDNRKLPLARSHSILHVAHALIQPACRNVAPRDIRHTRNVCLLAFARQPGSEPVRLAGLIAIDIHESETCEPRRGPCAHVSLVVVAVDDEGPTRVESLGGFTVEGFQRNVDRSGEVFGLVFFRSQDVNELSPLLNEVLGAVPVDNSRHDSSPLLLQRAAGGAAEGGDPLADARKPRRLTASTICSTVTWAGSKATAASFALRLTSARLTPFSPSRAVLTAMGQLPPVMPSTLSTTVEVMANAVFAN